MIFITFRNTNTSQAYNREQRRKKYFELWACYLGWIEK